MMWTIRKQEIAQKLQLIGSMVGRKQMLPILSHLLWQVYDNKVKITVSDLDVELTTWISLESGDSACNITFPSKKFLYIIRAAPHESSIQIELIGDRVEIRYTQNRFILSTLPAVQFPVMKPLGECHELVIPHNNLKWLIERTQFSIAKEDVRYYLSSLLLEIKNNCLWSTTSDAHRLSYAAVELDCSLYKGLEQILLSRRAVVEIDRLLAHSKEKIIIRTTNENFFQLKTEQAILTTKLVEGKVPHYQNAFSNDVIGCMTVEREGLKQALDRAAILSYSDESNIRIKIIHGKLIIFAGFGCQESAEIEVPSDYSGEELEVVFNIHYLLEVLLVLDKRYIRISWGNPSAGMIFEEVGLEATFRCQYLVMPICD